MTNSVTLHITVYRNGWHIILNGGKTIYKDFDELPENIKEKLAVLLVADAGAELPGVGRRTSQYRFWIYQ